MHVVVVVSGLGTKGVGVLEGTAVVIIGSGAEATIVGRLAGTVVFFGRSAREIVVLVVIGT